MANANGAAGANGKQDVAIIGAGGYTGRELLTILAGHEGLRPVHITSGAYAGKKVGEVFPMLDGRLDLTFENHDAPIPEGVPVFLAVPNDTSLQLVPELHKRGHMVVDLSGSYRLHDKAIFEKYYKLEHSSFELMDQVVFGLPEIFREKIKSSRLVSNPGCFSTGSILPLYMLGDYRGELRDIIIDAKSGVSGAGGRTEDAGFGFGSVYENFRAYKILRHQHQPEIQEYSAHGSSLDFPIIFTPHLLPLFRGILSTIVLLWKEQPPADLDNRFRAAAENEPFIRLRGEPEDIDLAKVQGTNFLDIGMRTEGNRTVIVSALDNLMKGAAGQAIQNMNLMLGFSETAGLL